MLRTIRLAQIQQIHTIFQKSCVPTTPSCTAWTPRRLNNSLPGWILLSDQWLAWLRLSSNGFCCFSLISTTPLSAARQLVQHRPVAESDEIALRLPLPEKMLNVLATKLPQQLLGFLLLRQFHLWSLSVAIHTELGSGVQANTIGNKTISMLLAALHAKSSTLQPCRRHAWHLSLPLNLCHKSGSYCSHLKASMKCVNSARVRWHVLGSCLKNLTCAHRGVQFEALCTNILLRACPCWQHKPAAIHNDAPSPPF